MKHIAALYLINPFIGLLFSLKRNYWWSLRFGLWFFVVWFALTFSVGQESMGSDQQRYFDQVSIYHLESWSFLEAYQNYSFAEQGDLFRHFSIWFVSMFTDNGYVYLIFVALILGFFYSSNIVYLLRCLNNSGKQKMPIYIWLLVVSLFFAAPVHDIGGVRYINATHMALYGILPFIFEKKKRRLVFLLVSPLLFHFGMWIFVFVFFLAYFLLKMMSGFPRIILLSFIFSSILTGFLQEDMVGFLRYNSIIQDNFEFASGRTDAYFSDQSIESLENARIFGGDRNWYANLFPYAIRWSVITVLFALGFNRFFRKENKADKGSRSDKSFLFILLLFIIFNGLIGLPSISRFESILNFLGLSYILIHWAQTKSRTIYAVIKWIWPALVLFLVVSIRSSIYNLSFMTFLGSPITAVFTVGQNVPLNDTLKAILGL